MNTAPTIEILSKLKDQEWSELLEYIQTSFSGASRLATELFVLLHDKRAIWSDLGSSGAKEFLDRHNLYSALYGKEPYRDQRIRRVFMELQAAFKSFIAFRASRQGHWLAVEADYLDFLLQCGAYVLFRKTLDKAFRKLEQSPPVDDNLQYLIARIRGMENEYFIHTGGTHDSFDELDAALDRQYLSRKLENWTSMRTREKRYPQKHQFSFRNEVKGMVRVAPLDKWPEVALWNLVFRLESAHADRDDYLALEASVRELGSVLPLGKLRQVRGYMFNFLIRHLRSELREDYRELWHLARTMLDEGTLHLHGRLSESFMRAAVQSACFAGEADWAAAFLEAHGRDLVGPDSDQVLALHRLMVSYHQGDYRSVLRGSIILNYGNPRFDVQLRVLQLKSCFDLQMEEDYLRMAGSFRKLMARKKNLGQRFIAAYTAFSVFAERLGRQHFILRAGSEQLSKEVLLSDTAEKLWLLDKIGSLNR